MDFREWQKRLGIITTVSGLIFVSIVARLYQKAVVEHAGASQAAQDQYAYRKEVVGQRGDIVVQVGQDNYFPLATNEERYQVLAIPSNIKNPQAVAKQLAPILGLSEAEVFGKINNKKQYIPPLKRGLNRDQADAVAKLRTVGMVLIPEASRTYPEASLASQILGFVNNEGKGNYGIEGTYDSVLQGTTGYQLGQQDNRGQLIRVGDEVKAKNGARIVLTIDREMQHYVEQALADAVKNFQADSGSVIVMNPKTGAILTMASVPTFDPNNFKDVPQDQQGVFVNPNVAGVWEPGSIMKPVIMALALDKNLIQPDTKQTFAASVKVLNHDIFTAEKKAFGEETMTQVLENSDNVGMVWIAEKLGNNDQYDGLKKMGFGTVPDLKLSNTVSGYLLPVKKWNDLTRATTAFGQGVSVTPLQMVMAYSALANKGALMQPYLVSQVLDDKGVLATTSPKVTAQVVSPETSGKITTMLESVVVNGLGKRAKVPGYRIVGKTGTAQMPKPDGGYYDDRHIGSFAGYFPASDPQYAMVVKLDNPKTVNFAESSAGPTFGQIAGWILHHDQIKPDQPNQ